MAEQVYQTLDKFDRLMGALIGLPDVTCTKPSVIETLHPILGQTQTVIVRTFRQREIGDTIFLQVIDDQGSVRIHLPPAAAEAIARQRDALSTKNRRKAGKEQAQARKARGELPGFMKGRKRKATGTE